MTKALLLVFAGFWTTGGALADQVTLKNGDRITGSVVKSDGKALTLKSEYAGTIAIDWNAVETIASTAPLYVTLKGGQVLLGPVATVSGHLEVTTAESGVKPVEKAQVDIIRSKQEQDAAQADIDRYNHPSLLALWAGFVEAGLSMARGNADATTFNLGMNAVRDSRRDKITVNLTSLYAKNAINGVSTLAADAVRGGVRYDRNIGSRAFGFAFTTEEYDRFQHLDLRAVFGGGFGAHVVKRDMTTFDVFGGASLNRENYTSLTRTSAEAVIGEEFSHKFSKTTMVTERFTLYPDFSSPGELRATLNSSAVAAISKWLSFHITFTDVYVTNPPPGIKKNDALLSTGIRYSFAR